LIGAFLGMPTTSAGAVLIGMASALSMLLPKLASRKSRMRRDRGVLIRKRRSILYS
jgi:hypothetical protein